MPSFRQEVCSDTSGDLLPDLVFDQRSVHELGPGVDDTVLVSTPSTTSSVTTVRVCWVLVRQKGRA